MTDFSALGLPADLPGITAPEFGASGDSDVSVQLNKHEKAAIVVRVLVSGGEQLALSDLPQSMQSQLANTLASLKGIDKGVERKVVAEFLAELDSGASAYGGGLESALSLLEGSISEDVATELMGGVKIVPTGDPWPRVADFPSEKIAKLLEQERAEVAAICLSKLPGKKAAEVLGAMEGAVARRAAYSVSRISSASPDVVKTIGRSLASQLANEPRTAFSSDPAALVGSMLLSANSKTRDDILDGLREEDKTFADRVREEIFVFGDIAERIETTDVPKLLRAVEQDRLLEAFKFSADQGGNDAASAEFILENMSKRMAESLREDMAGMGAVPGELGELAQGALVESIRDLEASGELTLKPRETQEAA